MKLFISCMTMSLLVNANLIVIYDTTNGEGHKILKEAFEKRYEIPSKLITYKLVDDCPEDLERFNALAICTNKKELEVLNSNSSIIRSLSVFKSEIE